MSFAVTAGETTGHGSGVMVQNYLPAPHHGPLLSLLQCQDLIPDVSKLRYIVEVHGLPRVSLQVVEQGLGEWLEVSLGDEFVLFVSECGAPARLAVSEVVEEHFPLRSLIFAVTGVQEEVGDVQTIIVTDWRVGWPW